MPSLWPYGDKPILKCDPYHIAFWQRYRGCRVPAVRDPRASLGADDEAGAANPPADAAIGFSVSPSGRVLRDFIKQGFNQDERGRKLFHGVLRHIAGSGGVCLNAEFAQPFRTRTQHKDSTMPGNSFPFSAGTLHSPVGTSEASAASTRSVRSIAD